MQRVLARTLIEVKKKYSDLTYQRMHTLYRKFDPVRGMDYQLHLMFADNSNGGKTIMKRLFYNFIKCMKEFFFKLFIFSVFAISFEAVKPLGRVEIVPSPYVTESTRIAMLLPTFEHQIKETIEFISIYEKTCMEHQDNTFLMLVTNLSVFL